MDSCNGSKCQARVQPISNGTAVWKVLGPTYTCSWAPMENISPRCSYLAIGHMVLKISKVRVNLSLTGADLSRSPEFHERRLNSCDSLSISEVVGGS